jgi:hypothetical protein
LIAEIQFELQSEFDFINERGLMGGTLEELFRRYIILITLFLNLTQNAGKLLSAELDPSAAAPVLPGANAGLRLNAPANPKLAGPRLWLSAQPLVIYSAKLNASPP